MSDNLVIKGVHIMYEINDKVIFIVDEKTHIGFIVGYNNGKYGIDCISFEDIVEVEENSIVEEINRF